MNAIEIYGEAERRAGKGQVHDIFEIKMPGPKQVAEELKKMGYTPDDLLKMEHDAVMEETVRQLKIGADKWEPIDYDTLEKECNDNI
ncbi:MAG: hypothetical protein SPL63_12775 [Roseburia faecis]|jgi:hypothetical protein|nr:hypothetical protein [Lachnospiraceae bacterium]MDY6280971.1 hypothetical protein [Roseburia faecis]